jgi:hypothetical protein
VLILVAVFEGEERQAEVSKQANKVLENPVEEIHTTPEKTA